MPDPVTVASKFSLVNSRVAIVFPYRFISSS
jgi:hypothetical protein